MTRRHFMANRADDNQLLKNGAESDADALFNDLEQGITPGNKEEARDNLANAYREYDYSDKYRLVRLNKVNSEYFEDDLEIIGLEPEAVMLPKIESVEEVKKANKKITEIESTNGIPEGSTDLFVMIETPRAICEAYQILSSVPRMSGVFFGHNDFTEKVGASLMLEEEFLDINPYNIMTWALYKTITAARAAGLNDIVAAARTQLHDEEKTIKTCRHLYSQGVTGVLIYRPEMIGWVNEAYHPSEEHVDYAKRVINAFEKAGEQERAVTLVNDRLLEDPLYKKSKKITELSKDG